MPGARKSRFDAIKSAVETWAKCNPASCIEPVMLAPMGPVSQSEAKSWAKLCFGLEQVRSDAEALVSALFPSPVAELDLAQFAAAVERCGWFHNLKD